jgi:hypothetical protein
MQHSSSNPSSISSMKPSMFQLESNHFMVLDGSCLLSGEWGYTPGGSWTKLSYWK